MTAESEIEPDTKDWTWVLDRPCPECGFDATAVTVDRIPEVVRDNATTWEAVLTLPDVAVRPDPTTWSPLEYSCHVRDVHRVFDLRVGLMLDEDEPTFANWDQDETAVAERYAEQDPATVSEDLLAAAEQVAERYDSVPPGAWGRRGLRSNGSEFTVESIGLYHLHDIVHHAWDVRSAVVRATVEAYDASAAGYRDAAAIAPEAIRRRVSAFAAAVGPGGRVLEVGSAGGRDVVLLEEAGLDVRCTDITPAFVEMLRAAGRDADRLDPLHDDLDDPQRPGTPYDGVWANACLLHVARTDLPVVLGRLAAATRPGGVLGLSLKQGDGDSWSTHGRVDGRRFFTYWQPEPLRAVLEASGWQVDSLTSERGSETEQLWLIGQASRLR
ncbi:methyltransferase domain-containing protein [Nocardioides mangrovi]|uniref:Methyltransferase domain-containing protein n=1 Tax=Nocardioides mangrovi TaxID=2874580 RepID=A0ABS7UIG5_9ACTN|nr:methyltransferase domain-containing protein [Nocardioides mangrovi]MBZ5740382.1 methyltransferase domain-containing protein [Nocardioides mangrovi]